MHSAEDAQAVADATDEAAAAAAPATPTSPASPGSAAPLVRRPVGPKSRRPPTQLLRLGEAAAASSPSAAAEAVLSPTIIIFEELEELDVEGGGADLPADCSPAAEAQDEEAPRPPPHPLLRPLPRGAVPLMGPPGLGAVPLPRLSRLPSPQPQAQEQREAAPNSNLAEPHVPRLRRSPGPAAAGPPAGMLVADPLALRQQLRRTAAPARSPDGPPHDAGLAANAAAAAAETPCSPSPPPPKPRPPRSQDAPEGPSPPAESPAPRLRRPVGAPPAPPGLGMPDFLAARQHLRKTVAPGALAISPETEALPQPPTQPPPPQPLPRQGPPPRPPPPQLHTSQQQPPPQLPPKPRERRVGGIKDEDGDKAAVH